VTDGGRNNTGNQFAGGGVNAHDKRVYSTIFMLPQIFFFAKVCGIFWPDNCQKGVSEALKSE